MCDGVRSCDREFETSIAPYDHDNRTARTRERTLSVTTLAMKGSFHAPELDPEFSRGNITATSCLTMCWADGSHLIASCWYVFLWRSSWCFYLLQHLGTRSWFLRDYRTSQNTR